MQVGGCRFRARGNDVDRRTFAVGWWVADGRGLPLRCLLSGVPSKSTVALGQDIDEVQNTVCHSESDCHFMGHTSRLVAPQNQDSGNDAVALQGVQPHGKSWTVTDTWDTAWPLAPPTDPPSGRVATHPLRIHAKRIHAQPNPTPSPTTVTMRGCHHNLSHSRGGDFVPLIRSGPIPCRSSRKRKSF